MHENLVTVERDGAIAWVRLNRPDAGNAVNQALAERLRSVVNELDADESCRVLMLASTGKLFCAGGDVAAISGADDQAEYLATLAETIHDALLTLSASRLIMVSVVNGAAAGAGLGLVLNSDLVLAGPKAVFLSAYAGVGLSPDCGVSRLLPEVIGPRRATEMTLAGRTLTPDEARDWGLINEVFDDADALNARASELAASLAESADGVLGMTKRLLKSSFSDYKTHLDDEVTGLRNMVVRPETQQRLAAFVARSKQKSAS